MDFNKEELDFLRSKKIVRNNLINYNLELVKKIDYYCQYNNINFSEAIYLIINGLETNLCANCKKIKTEFISVKKGYKKYCSKKCSNSHIDTKENKKKIYLERYGVINPSFNIDIKNKISEKNKNQTKETKEKRKKTNLEKWGYEYNIVNPIIQEKKNNILSELKVSQKRKKTNLEKWGVEFPMKSDSIKSKFKKTNLDKWGNEHFKLSLKYKQLDKKRHLEKLNNEHEEFIINDLSNKTYFIFCNSCKNKFEISTNSYNIRKNKNLQICNICNPIEKNISLLENDLLNYISSIYTGIIKTSDRTLGFELDIYLPKLKIAFEFNGIYWHSEFFKTKEYHYNKYYKCLENNIQLMQIWEDDWNYKKEIVKSIILNKINKSDRIWARKCRIKEIDDNKIIKDFLNKNHIQGWCISTIKIGLFYNDELVSLITFGQLRKSLGSNKEENVYELLRFCNKLNTSVVGGSSKLLNFFIKKYNPIKIISYSKNDYSVGNLYKKLGFERKSDNINYFWIVNNIKINRWNYRKDKLVKMGHDSSKTETKIMHELGHYRVYDSGNTKWEFNRIF